MSEQNHTRAGSDSAAATAASSGASSGTMFYSPDGKMIDSADASDVPALGNRRSKRAKQPTDSRPEAEAVPDPQSGRARKEPADGAPPASSKAGGSAEDIADELGDAIHERFMSALRDKLIANDGYLSDDDVEEMSQGLRDQLSDIREIFLDAVDTHARSRVTRRETADRKQGFKRIMVSKFENRFAPEHVVARQPDRLSRRMLPGFFSAMSMLLGSEKLRRYEERAGTVAGALRNRLGDDFTWDSVYRSTDARKIGLRALIDISWHFRNLDKRVAWLTALINSNIIPQPGGPAEDWALTEDTARLMLRDLFGDLVTTLSNKAAHDALVRELGRERVTALKAFLHALY